MVIKLGYPVRLGEREITELTYPEYPALMHMFAGDAYEMGTSKYDAAIISSLSGEPIDLLARMHLADWVHVQAVTHEFITKAYASDKSKEGGSKNPPQAAP